MKKIPGMPTNPARRRLITQGTTSMLGLGMASSFSSSLGAQDCSIGCPVPPENGGVGSQDVYLTGNPQITHFKTTYRRHTDFTRETIALSLNGAPAFGSNVSVDITRNGDLVSNMCLQVKLPDIRDAHGDPVIWADNLGHALLKEAELEIGGTRIDRHSSDWLEILKELNVDESKQAGFESMIGGGMMGEGEKYIYIPLQFFFNRDPGLALPLIALQFHEVRIHFRFEELYKLIVSEGFYVSGPIPDVQLLVDYIFLGSEERRRFAQVGHEYLIEQVQYTEVAVTGDTQQIELDFNHPVKALYVVLQNESTSFGSGQPLHYLDHLEYMRLNINGHEREERFPGTYYRTMHACNTHTRIPTKPVYPFSFALYPELHQPSGTTNFSRIDNAQLSIWLNTNDPPGMPPPLTLPADTIKIFALNYNVLRIMSGLGGLAYSN